MMHRGYRCLGLGAVFDDEIGERHRRHMLRRARKEVSRKGVDDEAPGACSARHSAIFGAAHINRTPMPRRDLYHWRTTDAVVDFYFARARPVRPRTWGMRGAGGIAGATSSSASAASSQARASFR